MPCFDCPGEKLAEYLASPAGQWISITVDLDFALQSRIQIPLERISYLEFCLLRLLADERNKWEVEQMKKATPKSHGR